MRRLWPAVGLFLATSAYGATPDTLVLTSPTFAPLSVDNLLVTPTGSAQTTLSAALASAGAGGSPTFSNVAVSTSTGPVATSFQSNPAIATEATGFGAVITYDPSTGGGTQFDAWPMILTTISPSQSTADLWENWNSYLYINGPGIMSHEVNTMHSNTQVNLGGTLTTSEGLESSLFNFGTVSGNFDDVLGTNLNESTGTVGALRAFHALLVQNNTTAGSITSWTGLLCDAITGPGTAPTTDYCLLNKDPNGAISSAGPMLLGGTVGGLPSSKHMLDIHGVDQLNTSLNLAVYDSSNNLQFYVSNLGTAFFAQQLSLGSGTTFGALILQTTTSGDSVRFLPGSGTASGITNWTMPQGTSTTAAGLALTQTFTATNTFSGTANFSGTLQGAGVAGVTCASITAGTVTVSNGIVTHC